MASAPTVVVVGAGLAGSRTCQALSQRSYPGRVVLVGAESHRPYDRPPLSKQVLRGEVEDTTLTGDLGSTELRLGVRATGLRGQQLVTTQGDLPFDVLVVATGATPHPLRGEGPLTLRTIEDARTLRTRLRPGCSVAIAGAGWIGAEVATAASAAGCSVTVVDPASAPLTQALGGEVGTATLGWWQAAGVILHLGVGVERAGSSMLSLSDGRVCEADVVLVATGVSAEVGWLDGSGVLVDRGVVVDAHCRSVSRPDVFAVGDCAAWWSARVGALIRVQHWDDALRAPETVAAVLTGDVRATHDPVPYVWSDQFGRTIQYAGYRSGDERLLWRGSAADPSWCACWLDATGRLRALAAVGRPRDVVAGRRRIASGQPLDPARLLDPQLPLKDV